MCSHDDGQAHGHRADVSAGMPRPVEGDPVDPIVLEPVDEVVVTTLVDNSYDGLMVDMGPAERMAMGRTPPVPCALFGEGNTVRGLASISQPSRPSCSATCTSITPAGSRGSPGGGAETAYHWSCTDTCGLVGASSCPASGRSEYLVSCGAASRARSSVAPLHTHARTLRLLLA